MHLVKTVPVRDGLARWGQVLEDHRTSLADLDVEVSFVEVPGIDLEEIKDQADSDRVADAQARLVRELAVSPSPPDAVALGCLLEPGLDQLGDLGLPVTGEIEASVRLLATPAHPVGFVAGSPGALEGIRSRVATHGLERLVGPVRTIDAAPLRFTERGAEAELGAAMAAEVAEIAALGVRYVVGYGSAALLREVSRQTGVTVCSPVSVSLRATAAALAAARI